MGDDIIPLRHSYVQTMVERISELEVEVERLRAAGDEMAMHLDAHYGLGAPCPSDVRHALVTWREARRG